MHTDKKNAETQRTQRTAEIFSTALLCVFCVFAFHSIRVHQCPSVVKT
jgi:hypothetical protein